MTPHALRERESGFRNAVRRSGRQRLLRRVPRTGLLRTLEIRARNWPAGAARAGDRNRDASVRSRVGCIDSVLSETAYELEGCRSGIRFRWIVGFLASAAACNEEGDQNDRDG